MKQIGKIGKINIEANKKLKEIYEDKDIRYCELRLEGCTISSFLTFAHRHKREWYRSKPELLSDFNQTLLACQNCHNKIEDSRELTEEKFNQLREQE